jgi:hypothetical protein
MGFWQHDEIAAVNTMSRGRVSLRHLGKRVPFDSLPQAVQDTYLYTNKKITHGKFC